MSPSADIFLLVYEYVTHTVIIRYIIVPSRVTPWNRCPTQFVISPELDNGLSFCFGRQRMLCISALSASF